MTAYTSNQKINRDDFYIRPLIEQRNDEPYEDFVHMKFIKIGEKVKIFGPLDILEWPEDTMLHKIPLPLQSLECWIWLDYKEGFQTEPYISRGVKPEQALSKINWLPFNTRTSECGKGLVLCDEAIVNNKRVVAISVDHQSGLSRSDIYSLWKLLNTTYREITPNGFIFIGLVNSPAQNISYSGFKVSYSDAYVELTGHGRGQLAVIDLSCISTAPLFTGSQKNKPINKMPRTERNVARVKKALTFIDADCSYDIYIRVVWSILATGWRGDASKIAENWSLTAPHRFDERCLENLVRDFDPEKEKAIGVGTLFNIAKEGGFHG